MSFIRSSRRTHGGARAALRQPRQRQQRSAQHDGDDCKRDEQLRAKLRGDSRVLAAEVQAHLAAPLRRFRILRCGRRGRGPIQAGVSAGACSRVRREKKKLCMTA
jgi:hypothetical protein